MATNRQARNVERVRTGFDAFNRGDFEAVLAVLDVEVEIVASRELMNSGRFRGHAGYREWLSGWLEAWDRFEPQIERIEPVGERHVVAGVRQSARGRESGIPVEMEVAFMFELGGETATALHLYTSWDEAVAEAERREREGAPRD
jgi:ketosteroid isomerase-like protein